MAKKPLRDMVVLLPGITGSVLREGNSDVWAISGQALWRWLASAGDSLQDLRLTNGGPGPQGDEQYRVYHTSFQEFLAEEGIGLKPSHQRITEAALRKIPGFLDRS